MKATAFRIGIAALAYGVALGVSGCATSMQEAQDGPGIAAPSVSGNSAPIRAGAVPGVKADGADWQQWLLDADIDRLFASVRASEESETDDALLAAMAPLAIVFDDVAAGRSGDARARLNALKGAARRISGLAAPWVALAEGDKARALNEAQSAANMAPVMVGLQTALLHEASGDLPAAKAQYAALERTLDLTPPGLNEPRTQEEFLRRLQASQTAHVLYRAGLTAHRAGDSAEAIRLYDLVEAFSPRAPDVAANRIRAREARGPIEPPLDLVRGMGRWLLFVAEDLNRAEGLQKAINDPGATEELPSAAGAMLALAGVAYDPSADDWKLELSRILYAANAYDGADRIAARVGDRSVFAPEAALLRARVALRRNNPGEAGRLAGAAMRMASTRYDIALAGAYIFNEADQDRGAVAAFDQAVRLAPGDKERADALIARASMHLHFGRIDAAVADARTALATDRRNEAVRMVAIAIFKDRADTWNEAVSIGRELLRENPDSVSRLNQLGYTLIHRAEGLDEGLVLLHRGASLNPTDYAVVDSLGWAYYLFGEFDEALRLIKRAHELTGDDHNAEILDHLGDAHWRLNQQEDARKAWRAALEAGPEASRKRELEAKLRGGLTTPAPVKRPLPPLEEVKPRERQDI